MDPPEPSIAVNPAASPHQERWYGNTGCTGIA